MAEKSKQDEPFVSVADALQIFKRGTRGPHWVEAAEYMIRHASYDTRMLIDYVVEKTRREAGIAPPPPPPRRWHPAWLVAAAAGGVGLLGLLIWLFIWLFQQYGCR